MQYVRLVDSTTPNTNSPVDNNNQGSIGATIDEDTGDA